MSGMKRLVENFNYYFDNNHGDVIIGNYTFSAADVLREFDPIAYNQEFNEWLNIQEAV